MVREIDKRSLVVDEGDLVIVSNTSNKKDGVFAEVGIAELVEGEALVGFRPVIDDKTKHRCLTGKLLPNLSPKKSVLLTRTSPIFIDGKNFSITVPNKFDKARHLLGRKLLGG